MSDKDKQVMFSDFQWCEIHYPKYGNPITLHLEDRHGCVLPVGDVRIVNALIRVLQGAVIKMGQEVAQSEEFVTDTTCIYFNSCKYDPINAVNVVCDMCVNKTTECTAS